LLSFKHNIESKFFSAQSLELIKKITGNGIIQLASKTAIIVISVLVSNQLGAGFWGEISFMISTVSIVSTIILFGLDRFLVKDLATKIFSSNKEINYNPFYNALKTTFIFGLILFFLVYFFIADFLLDNKGYIVFKSGLGLAAFLFIIDPLIKLLSSLLNANNRVNWSQLIKNNGVNIFTCLFLIGLFILPSKFFNFQNVISSFLFSYIFVFVLGTFLIKKHLKINELIKAKIDYKIFRYSTPFFLISLSPVLRNNLDRVLLGFLESPEQLAIYDVSIKLSNITGFFLFISLSALAPKIAQLKSSSQKNNTQKLYILLRKTSLLMLIPSLIVFLAFVFFGQTVLEMWGTNFVKGHNILILVSIAQLFAVFSGPVSVLLQMTGHEKQVSKAVLISSITQATVLMLTPFFGIMIAALAYFLAIVIENIMNLRYAHKNLSYKLI
jgi:O-antigen/teichoic acid export membrane protein